MSRTLAAGSACEKRWHSSGADWPVPRWSTSKRSRSASKNPSFPTYMEADSIAFSPGPPMSTAIGSGGVRRALWCGFEAAGVP